MRTLSTAARGNFQLLKCELDEPEASREFHRRRKRQGTWPIAGGDGGSARKGMDCLSVSLGSDYGAEALIKGATAAASIATAVAAKRKLGLCLGPK
jgi:hypothetical protein